MSIRHADLDDLDTPAVAKAETAKALREWWARWESLPVTERDLPAAEVLAEQCVHD